MRYRFYFTVLLAAFLVPGAGCGSRPLGVAPPVVAAAEQAPDDAPQKTPSEADAQASRGAAQPEEAPHPFPRRIRVPEFPKDTQWLNVSGPLPMRDLRGKFVLLDFWTYCCINCIHILPELKKLEQSYPNELVVIGVHSAKFETEKDQKNIEEAILRYEIEHPVVNDANHIIWEMYGASSWPTVLLVDPEGNAVWGTTGEIKFEDVDPLLKDGLPYYRQRGLLDDTPLRFDLLAHAQPETPLRFPGKVLADQQVDRLFIADSNHNRLLITTREGQLLETIGSGAMGRDDGGFPSCTFDHPQGMALFGETLYVADTENHLIRKVDLQNKRVETIAGTGAQGRRPWPGLEELGPNDAPPERWVGRPRETPLNSPWDLWVHDGDLYIAMAGPHQIWKMPLDQSEIGPYAGNGREDIVDGPLLPRFPYALGYASFAQPSGLTSDGQWLYVADSEGSSIRAVPFDPTQQVRTVVGTADLPFARLFTFGDRDGQREEVQLQHVLGVAYHAGKIYAADTYNNKVKVVDASTGETTTLAGSGQAGSGDEPAEFDEPAGIAYAAGTLYVADTNNHAIRTVDIATGKVGTLEIAGLTPPARPQEPSRPRFKRAVQHKLETSTRRPVAGAIQLSVQLQLPAGWKINKLAPAHYWLEVEGEAGPVDRAALGRKSLATPAASFDVTLPVSGEGTDVVQLAMQYFYCQEGSEGLCKVGSVVWTVPLQLTDQGSTDPVVLIHQVEK